MGGCAPPVTLFSEHSEAPDVTSGRAWKIAENVSSSVAARVVVDFT